MTTSAGLTMKCTLLAVSLIVVRGHPDVAQVGVVNPNVPVTSHGCRRLRARRREPRRTHRPSLPFSQRAESVEQRASDAAQRRLSGTGGFGRPGPADLRAPQARPDRYVYNQYMEAAGEPWATQTPSFRGTSSPRRRSGTSTRSVGRSTALRRASTSGRGCPRHSSLSRRGVSQDPDRQPRRDRAADHAHVPQRWASAPSSRTRRRTRSRCPCGWPTSRSASAPTPARASYLNMPSSFRTAMVTDSEPIHPGYGFLASQTRRLSDICRASGLTFIGPSPEAIRLMGDKAQARVIAKQAGVPVVPAASCRSRTKRRRWTSPDAAGYPVISRPRPAAAAAACASCATAPAARAGVRRLSGRGGPPRSAVRPDLTARNTSSGRRHVRGAGAGGTATGCASTSASATAPCKRRHQKLIENRRRRRCRPRRGPACIAPALLAAAAVNYFSADGGVPRRCRRRVLLHRDEHAHPGRASGDESITASISSASDPHPPGRRAARISAGRRALRRGTRSSAASTPEDPDTFRAQRRTRDGLGAAGRPRRARRQST